MFEGMDAGTPLVIVFAVILATFGVRFLDYLIVRRKEKRFDGEYDRRKPATSNPGNPGNPGNSGSAVALARVEVKLEGMVDKLGVFHRDFFDKTGEQTEALRDITTAIRELDKNTQGGHDRLRASVTELQKKVDEGNLLTETVIEKVDKP